MSACFFGNVVPAFALIRVQKDFALAFVVGFSARISANLRLKDFALGVDVVLMFST